MTRAINIAQSGGNNFTMRNRIINGDMKIDQRNNGAAKSVPVTTATYLTDRFFWYAVGAGVTAQQVAGTGAYSNELLITGATSNTANELWHRIESKNVSDLKNQTCTVQVEISSNSLTSVGWSIEVPSTADGWSGSYASVASGTFTVSSTPTIKTATFNVGANAANGIALRLIPGAMGSGVTLRITGIQLEAGTTATPFENRPYGMELALCQRYYYRLTGGGNTRHGISGNGSLSQGFPTVYFKVAMRTTPTFSYSSLSDFATEGIAGGGQATPNGMSWNSGTTDNATLNITSGGSGTATGVNLLGTGSGAYTAYSAEL